MRTDAEARRQSAWLRERVAGRRAAVEQMADSPEKRRRLRSLDAFDADADRLEANREDDA